MEDIEHIEKEMKLIGSDGRRLDGRSFDELRPIRIEAGVLRRADGSAYIEWGGNTVPAKRTRGTSRIPRAPSSSAGTTWRPSACPTASGPDPIGGPWRFRR